MKTIIQQLQSRIDTGANMIAEAETFPKDISKAQWKAVRELQTFHKRILAELISNARTVSHYAGLVDSLLKERAEGQREAVVWQD